MKPRDIAASDYALLHGPIATNSFVDGWEAALGRLKSEQHNIQLSETGVGWIPVDTIGGAIALLENGTS